MEPLGAALIVCEPPAFLSAALTAGAGAPPGPRRDVFLRYRAQTFAALAPVFWAFLSHRNSSEGIFTNNAFTEGLEAPTRNMLSGLYRLGAVSVRDADGVRDRGTRTPGARQDSAGDAAGASRGAATLGPGAEEDVRPGQAW